MLPRNYAAAVVVPVRDESPQLWVGLVDACRAGDALAIVVVNGSVEDNLDGDRRGRNEALWAGLRALGPSQPLRDDVVYLEDGRAGLLLVDRFRGAWALPTAQGVGLARKVGADLALNLCARGEVHDRFIRFTDADVTLPRTYFECSVPADAVALTYPFWHVAGAALGVLAQATAWYEVWLRAYVVGLAEAGSPYAFHTIGSTLAVDAVAYAQVRGVPKRRAGEDFHLLAKLAKLGAVVRPATDPILIAARRSERVPFGTGVAAARIAGTSRAGVDLRVYHPRSFELLAALLRWLARTSRVGTVTAADDADEDAALRVLRNVADPAGLNQAFTAARTAAARVRRCHEWFDALATLRFIHACRRAGFDDVAWPEGLCMGDTRDPDEFRRMLAAREPARAGLGVASTNT